MLLIADVRADATSPSVKIGGDVTWAHDLAIMTPDENWESSGDFWVDIIEAPAAREECALGEPTYQWTLTPENQGAYIPEDEKDQENTEVKIGCESSWRQTYTLQVTVTWEYTDEDGVVVDTVSTNDTIQIAAVNLKLDHDLWWFNGENPRGGYHVSANLTINGLPDGKVQWDVIQAANIVGLDTDNSTSKETASHTISVNSLGDSSTEDDVEIRISFNDSIITEFPLSVYTPDKADADPKNPYLNGKLDEGASCGYNTIYRFLDIKNQFGGVLTNNIPAHEWFGTFTKDWPFCNWPNPDAKVFTPQGSKNCYFEDSYKVNDFPDSPPPLVPEPVSPGKSWFDKAVMHGQQIYFIGSGEKDSVKGVPIKTHIVQYCLGEGLQK